MIDPVTIGAALYSGVSGLASSAPAWLPWASAGATAATAGVGAASLLSKGEDDTQKAPEPKIPAPPGVVPASQPNAKPQRKSQYQSFLSGASTAQQAQAGGGTGKSLLGA